MTINELHNAQLFLPIVLTFQRESLQIFLYHIGIFPLFYSVDRRATIPQALAQSICKDKDYMLSKADYVLGLSIYLTNPSDMPSISTLAKEMAVSFSKIGKLNLCFENRCEIVSILLTVTVMTIPRLI
jgi:hypothetical protein